MIGPPVAGGLGTCADAGDGVWPWAAAEVAAADAVCAGLVAGLVTGAAGLVVLTAAEDDRDVVRAMRLGARGIVLKQSASDLLVKSIHRVYSGEIWLDNRMTAEVMKAFAKSSDNGPRRDKPLLSDREKEIVQLVAQGYRNKEIGEKLFISEQTVKNHLHNIFDKLGVSDRLELALYAIHHRLIDHA